MAMRKTKKQSKKQSRNFQASIKASVSGKSRQYTFSLPAGKVRGLLSTAKKMEKIGENVLRRHAALAREDLSALTTQLMKDKNLSRIRKEAGNRAKKGLKKLEKSLKKKLRI